MKNFTFFSFAVGKKLFLYFLSPFVTPIDMKKQLQSNSWPYRTFFIPFLLILTLLSSVGVWGQATVFSENVGTPTATTIISTYNTGTAPATFQNKGVLGFVGNSDVRATTPSTGYTGASGTGNVFITNTIGQYFTIYNVDTSGYNALALSFGLNKSTAAGSTLASTQFVVEVATDYNSTTNTGTFTSLSYATVSTAATAWSLVTCTGAIPSSSTLAIRFRQATTTAAVRIDDIKLTGTVSVPCSGTPTGGSVTVNPTSGAPASTYGVSATSYSTGSGLIYQWQYSDTGGAPWTNQGSATSSYAALSGLTAPAFGVVRTWKLVVTCTASTISTDSTTGTFTSTYCIPSMTTASASGDFIGNVTFAGINNTTGDTASDYTYYPTPAANVVAGSTYPISLKAGGTTSLEAQQFGVWIDYNNNGVFSDPGEFVFATTSATFSPAVSTGNITIPALSAFILAGTKRMRVGSRYSSAVSATDYCLGASQYGEYEDYNVNITAPIGCVTPNSPTVATNSVTSTTLSVSITPPATNAPNGGYLVVRSLSSTPPTVANGTVYAGDATYTVVSNGTGTTVPETGLATNSKYYYYVYSQNTGCTGAPYYSAAVQTNVTTCAAAPTALSVGTITSSSANFTWTSPAGGGAGTISSTLNIYSANTYLPAALVTSVPNVSSVYTLSALSPNATYWYQVVNSNGVCSTSTNGSGSFTTSCTVPNAASNITFSAVSATGTTVNWSASSPTSTGYVVFRSTSATPPTLSNGTQYTPNQTAVIAALTNGSNTYYCVYNGTGTSGTASSLTGNTQYYYYVFSRNGTTGTSPDCSGAPWYSVVNLSGSQTTCAAAPTAPVNSAITSFGFTGSWSAAPVGGGAGSISYTMEVYSDVGYTTLVGSAYAGLTGTSNVVTGLNPSTSYWWRVKATNGFCESTYLNGTTFTTACSVTPITYSQGFNSTTTPICWTTQLVPVGGTATVASTASKITYVGSGTNPTTSPQEGTQMVLYNSFSSTGGGAGSEERLVAAPLSSIGNTSVDVIFYLRNENSTLYNSGAYLNEGVQVQYSTDGVIWTDAGPFFPRYDNTLSSGVAAWNLKTVTIPSALANSANFYIGLKFHSSFGNNVFLDKFTVLPTPTCVTPNLAATTSIASTTATINWTAPSPAPANGYNYEIRTSGAAGSGATGLTTSGSVAAGITTANITGLNAATAYSVYVQSDCGGSGTSTWSVAGTFTTACVVPNNPSISSFTNVSATGITLNYSAASPAPTTYVVFRSTSAVAPTPVNGTSYNAGTTYFTNYRCILNGTALTIADTGLVGNTKYYYYVFAQNSTNTCYGAPWYSTGVSSSQITCPAAPTSPTVTSVTGTSATINWLASAGGTAATVNYTLEVATDAAFAVPVAGSPFSVGTGVNYGLTGLMPNTPYYYRVKANNGSCDSAWLTNSSYTFTTLCNATPITVTEGFNSATVPACWSVQFPSSTNISFVASGTNPTVNPQEGSHMIRYNSFSTSVDERLRSLPMSSIGAGSVDIEFYFNRDNAYSGTASTEGVQLQYSLDGTTWVNAGAFVPRYSASITGWEKQVVTIPSALANSSNFLIGFNFLGDRGNNMYLDNVVVKPTPLPIVITSSEAMPVCTGTPTTLAASSSAVYTYTWSPAAGLNTTTGASVIASPVSTTTYTVTGTAGADSTAKSFTVTVNPVPAAISLTETPVSSGGLTACDLDYVQLSVGTIPAVPIITEGFENATDIFTEDRSGTFFADYYYDSNLKTEGTRSINFYGDYADGPDYISLDFTEGIDLTKFASAKITFDQICASQAGSDFGEIWYSIDGGSNWSKLPVSAYQGTATLKQGFVSFDKSSYSNWNTAITSSTSVPTNSLWKSEVLDLSQFMTSTNFKLSFLYSFNGGSSSSSDYYGWNVDNIKVNVTPKVTWSPTTGLYADAALTTPYVSGSAVTVYASPETPQIYTAAATFGTCGKTASSASIVTDKKTFTGTVNNNWSVAGNWLRGSVPTAAKCVSIPSGKTAVVDIPNAVAKNVTVVSGGKLTINKDQSLTVTDAFVNSNTTNFITATVPQQYYVMIESDGNLLQVNNGAANTGAISARREIAINDHNQYNYLISPLVGSNLKTNVYEDQATHALSSAPFTLYYNEANNKFYTSSGAYIPGRGLAVKEPAASVVPSGKINALFTGVPMNGDLSYTLANTGTAETGNNLVGNPYPSNIDIKKLYDDSPGITEKFQFWDNSANAITVQQGSAYKGAAYAVFNAATGSYGTGNPAPGNTVVDPDNPASAAGTKIPNHIVKVGQGFMVKATGAGTLNFKNTQRTADQTGSNFFGKNQTLRADDRYWLQLITPANLSVSNAVVYFDGGNNGFAKDDSEETGTSDALFTFAADKKVVINGRNVFHINDVLNVGTRQFTAGIYKIQLGNKEGVFANGQSIYLKDKQTGIITNLSAGAYSFSAAAGESTGRFEIIYQPEAVLATDAAVKEDIQVYRDGTDFVVKARSKKITGLEIYDASGRLIKQMQPDRLKVTVDSEIMSNGAYLLKINQGGATVVKKILK